MDQFKTSMYKMKDGGFQISYTNPITKKRHRKSFKSSVEAKSYKLKIERDYVKSDFSHFYEKPLGFIIAQHLKEFPNSKLTSRSRPFREFYNQFKNTRIEDLTTAIMRKWLEDLREKYNYSDSTILKVKLSLNIIFKYLEDKGVIIKSPLYSIRYNRICKPTRERIQLSKQQLMDITSNSKYWSKTGYDLEYFHPYLYLLIHTGARRSEGIKLKWKDVDFGLNQLTFRDTKTKEDRAIKMSPQLRAILEKLPRRGENVFTNRHGQQVHQNMVTRHLEIFRQRFPNDKKWGYHALRHSFAYHYLKDGGDMYQLQAILGHRKITTTIDIYGKITAKDDEKPSPYNF